jgi:hypothetical protein
VVISEIERKCLRRVLVINLEFLESTGEELILADAKKVMLVAPIICQRFLLT